MKIRKTIILVVKLYNYDALIIIITIIAFIVSFHKELLSKHIRFLLSLQNSWQMVQFLSALKLYSVITETHYH